MGSTTAPSAFTFHHDQLGDIIGWRRQGDTVQFRGLPFATIPERFRQSVLVDHLPNKAFDATKPGPVCSTPPLPYAHMWDGPLPEEYPVLQKAVVDELQCLNLSLTIPRNVLEEKGKGLPILIFIHGGALVGGNQALQCAGRELFDMHDLVQRSMNTGKPIIGVTINYRVGPLGFLASKELAAFNTSHGEPVGNYGFHDQVRAIEWVSRFINGFGGDPARITIHGTSAGSISCHQLSFFPNRLFSRVILASGVISTLGPVTVEEHQKIYDQLVGMIDTDSASADVSSLDLLRQCAVTDLTHKMEFDVCHPLIDGQYILENPMESASREQKALPILFGAAAYEDDIAEFLLTDMKTSRLRSGAEALSKFRQLLSSNSVVRAPETFPMDNTPILDAYGLTSAVDSPAWSELLGHCIFNIPTIQSALVTSESLPSGQGRVWLYHYAVKNLYPASHAGQAAHHGVNDMVLFNVAPDSIAEELRESWRASVLQTQDVWLTFVNGDSPWDPVRPGASIKDSEEAGPVFVFQDGGMGTQYTSLRDALGSVTAKKYASVLGAAVGSNSSS
ncbi:Alpha/Beta hydrolase protein [Aspergillus carlsbadensis]|nr:Alpha/Beta hydrolase protein [Aspergillus carlsbadensis]